MRASRGLGVSVLVVAVLAAIGDARADGLEAQREKFEIGVAHFREGR